MIDDPGYGSALDAGLPDAKRFLRIAESGEDAEVAALVVAATGVSETFLDRALVTRLFSETIAREARWQLLGRSPVQVITAVEDAAGDPLDVAAYAIDIDADGGGWVRFPGGGEGLATVRYQAGTGADWAAIAAPVRHAIIRLTAHLYTYRDALGIDGLPSAVTALLAPWRRLPLGATRVSR